METLHISFNYHNTHSTQLNIAQDNTTTQDNQKQKR